MMKDRVCSAQAARDRAPATERRRRIGAAPRLLVTPESEEIILAQYPRLGFKQVF